MLVTPTTTTVYGEVRRSVYPTIRNRITGHSLDIPTYSSCRPSYIDISMDTRVETESAMFLGSIVIFGPRFQRRHVALHYPAHRNARVSRVG